MKLWASRSQLLLNSPSLSLSLRHRAMETSLSLNLYDKSNCHQTKWRSSWKEISITQQDLSSLHFTFSLFVCVCVCMLTSNIFSLSQSGLSSSACPPGKLQVHPLSPKTPPHSAGNTELASCYG